MYWDSSYFSEGDVEGGRFNYYPDDPSGYGVPVGNGYNSSPPSTSQPQEHAEGVFSEGGWDFSYTRNPYTGVIERTQLGRTASGSSGGSSGPDHYFDVSGSTTATLAANADRDRITDAWNQAEAKRNQANEDRDWALKVGDQALARQKQADANHWAEVSAGLEAQRNAITAEGNQLQYKASTQASQLQYQAAMAQVAQSKYDSDQRFQVGMAGATNDQQRNQIAAQWNAEQAAIAKMEDETKLLLGQQANQTNQFGAETDRAARMGTLALDNNKFIAEMARSPRDLFSLYFMQRGLAPDWNAVTNGTAVAQGAALAPADVMHAYTPTTLPGTYNATNSERAGVGAASAAGVAAANAGNSFIGGSTAQAPPPMPSAAQVTGGGGVAAGGGAGVGALIPIQKYAPQMPGLNVSSPVDNIAGGTYTDENGTTFAHAQTPGGGQTFTTTGTDPNQARWTQAPDGSWSLSSTQRMSYGGFTTAKTVMAGDAPASNPAAGGAMPEVIHNPTGAPLQIERNPLTELMMRYGMMRGIERRALGTDASAAYGAQGMGSSWIPNSTTTYDPGTMPAALRGLAGYGAPISPSLYASATGNIAPTLNMGLAANARGVGVLPSLQGLNAMTDGEQKNYRGFAEGVGGLEWDALANYIARGTANLQRATVARAA